VPLAGRTKKAKKYNKWNGEDVYEESWRRRKWEKRREKLKPCGQGPKTVKGTLPNNGGKGRGVPE